MPCIVADDLTDEQIKAFRLADNKTAEIATWDFELLEKELADLVDFDMSDFGFDILEDKVPTTIINEDKPTRNKEHPTMKPIKLMARLIQNSSRKNEKVLK